MYFVLGVVWVVGGELVDSGWCHVTCDVCDMSYDTLYLIRIDTKFIIEKKNAFPNGLG